MRSPLLFFLFLTFALIKIRTAVPSHTHTHTHTNTSYTLAPPSLSSSFFSPTQGKNRAKAKELIRRVSIGLHIPVNRGRSPIRRVKGRDGKNDAAVSIGVKGRGGKNDAAEMLAEEEATATATAAEILQAADADGDGVLEQDELREFMEQQTGEHIGEVEFEKMVREADADGDGILNINELSNMVQSHREVFTTESHPPPSRMFTPESHPPPPRRRGGEEEEEDVFTSHSHPPPPRSSVDEQALFTPNSHPPPASAPPAPAPAPAPALKRPESRAGHKQSSDAARQTFKKLGELRRAAAAANVEEDEQAYY